MCFESVNTKMKYFTHETNFLPKCTPWDLDLYKFLNLFLAQHENVKVIAIQEEIFISN